MGILAHRASAGAKAAENRARRDVMDRVEAMKARVIGKEKRRLEAEMRLGRPLRPIRKPRGITKARMREIEEEKRRRREGQTDRNATQSGGLPMLG